MSPNTTALTKRDGPEGKCVFVPNQRPVCCDLGCVWFCRIMGSITTIAVCYYFAYTLISDTKLKTIGGRQESSRVVLPNQRPVCCDLGCIWFCGIMGSITIIALCYYFAYTLISDTKLRFGIFVPRMM